MIKLLLFFIISFVPNSGYLKAQSTEQSPSHEQVAVTYFECHILKQSQNLKKLKLYFIDSTSKQHSSIFAIQSCTKDSSLGKYLIKEDEGELIEDKDTSIQSINFTQIKKSSKRNGYKLIVYKSRRIEDKYFVNIRLYNEQRYDGYNVIVLMDIDKKVISWCQSRFIE
jgi:hypothetical protein